MIFFLQVMTANSHEVGIIEFFYTESSNDWIHIFLDLQSEKSCENEADIDLGIVI